MTYNAYEITAGTSVIESLEAHCRHLTSNGSFSPSSIPTLTDIERMIDETFYELQAHLAKNGYATAVTSTPVLGVLEKLNVFGAVVQIELTHPVTGRDGEGNERYFEYRRGWKEGIALLATDALEQLGHTREEALSSFIDVGGISTSRKQVLYEDTGAVQSRFVRGFGRNPQIPITQSGTVK